MAAAMSKLHSFIGHKRRRDAEDEVYFDNYHNQKRYLTEVKTQEVPIFFVGFSSRSIPAIAFDGVNANMLSRPLLVHVKTARNRDQLIASSMNGLRVSDLGGVARQPSSPVDPMSAAFSETVNTTSKSTSSVISHGDESSTLDSLMSEHSDENVGYRCNHGFDRVTTDFGSSNLASSCSPSPRRFQRLPCHGSGKLLPRSLTWASSRITSSPYTPSRWPRLLDTEDRLPGSPTDLSQTGDLRRATLLRNLSLRAQLFAQPTSTTVPNKGAEKHSEEQDSVEEDGDQSSPHSMDHVPQQVGSTIPLIGSPTHVVFPANAVRGSPRVRSLVLGDSTVSPKAGITAEASNKVDKRAAKLGQQSRSDEESSYGISPGSPRSPGSPKTVASSGHEMSSSPSSIDCNVSDRESSFSRRSANLTSLCRRPLVCLGDDNRFPVMETIRLMEPSDWIN